MYKFGTVIENYPQFISFSFNRKTAREWDM